MDRWFLAGRGINAAESEILRSGLKVIKNGKRINEQLIFCRGFEYFGGS